MRHDNARPTCANMDIIIHDVNRMRLRRLSTSDASRPAVDKGELKTLSAEPAPCVVEVEMMRQSRKPSSLIGVLVLTPSQVRCVQISNSRFPAPNAGDQKRLNRQIQIGSQMMFLDRIAPFHPFHEHPVFVILMVVCAASRLVALVEMNTLGVFKGHAESTI